MNSNNNINHGEFREIIPEKAPPVMASVLTAILCAVLAPLSLTLILVPLFCAGVIFLFSAKTPLVVRMIPIIGIAGSYLYGGIYLALFAAGLWLAAAVCGVVIRLGGDFHRALMANTFVLLVMAVGGAAAYMYQSGITTADIAAYTKSIFDESAAQITQMYGNVLPAQTIALAEERYAAFGEIAVLYLPAAAGFAAVVCGIVSLLFAGMLHSLTGTSSYPAVRRQAVVDPVFATVWLVSLLLGAVDGGAVGICASNIMMIFMLPCAAAGITAYKVQIRERRERGRRGLPFSLIFLIFVSVFASPVTGVMILSVNGALFAYSKKRFFVTR